MKPKDNHLQTHSFESSNHSSALLCGLNELRKEELLFDVTLVVGGHRFCAHRAVLAACSDYFRAMFTDALKESQQDEITLNGVTCTGFRCLLDYAYTSELTLNLSNIQSVLGAASHLQMFSVVDACSSYLISQLDLDNCIDILHLTETYTLSRTRKAVFCFLGQSLPKLMWSPDFQRLNVDQFLHLLDSDYPIACKEAKVLQAVLHWVNVDTAGRNNLLTQLLKLINFDSIEIQEIQRVKCHRLFTNNISALSVIVDALWKRENVHAQYIPGLVNPRGFHKVPVTVGGFNTHQGMTNDLTYYDPRAEGWKHLTTIPHIDQCNFGVAVLKNEIYVVGGCFNNQSLQEQIHPFGFKYNVSSDEWSSISMLEEERCRFCMVKLHGKLYAIGGMKEQESLVEESSCEVYDPEQDTWNEIEPVPYQVARHAGTALGGKIYISGGYGLHEEVLDHFFAYSPLHDIWTRKPQMLSPRVDHCMVSYKHRVLVAGGWNEDLNTGHQPVLATVDSFDTLTNQWEVLTRMPTPRYNMSALLSDQYLVLTGGHRRNSVSRNCKVIEKYNLATDGWEEAETYPTELWEHASCELYVPMCREDKAIDM